MSFWKQNASQYPAIVFLFPNLFMGLVILNELLQTRESYFSKYLAWLFLGSMVVLVYAILSTLFRKWKEISKVQTFLVALEMISLLGLIIYWFSLRGIFLSLF